MKKPITFTLITSEKPSILTKSFDLLGDQLQKHSAGNMNSGHAKKITIQSPREFNTLRNGLTSAQAICAGIAIGHPDALIKTDKFKGKGSISRTGEYFKFSNDAGIFILDSDQPKNGLALSREQLFEQLFKVAPELKFAPMLWTVSASSCIRNRKEGFEYTGISGQRIYIFVQDASFIPNAGKTIMSRLCAAGNFQIEMSKAGARLVRSIFDKSVWTPEHLDFAASPVMLHPDLERATPDAVFYNEDADWFDLSCLNLEAKIQLRAERKIEVAKEVALPQSITIRETWISERVPEFASRRKIPENVAQKILRRAVEGEILYGSFEFILQGGKIVTVAEILSEPLRFHELRCHDPIEPEYGNDDDRIAMFIYDSTTETMKCHSHAHGSHFHLLQLNDSETFEEAISRLAALPTHEYERIRAANAKALGVQLKTLDAAIKGFFKNTEIPNDEMFPEIEPWEHAISPEELLNEIVKVIERHIVCEHETAIAAALWATMTWFIDVIHVAPLAVITAPEKRCGKSQLLALLMRIAFKPLSASNITPAALFRSIDKWHPTLLIDEADAFLRENEELRGLLNCGHTRDTAFSIRTTGDDHVPTKFDLWGAKALAGIGHLADTLMDRAITLELRRKLPHEKTEKLRYADGTVFATLRRKLARFALDSSEKIRISRPVLPETLNDRAQDNWEPLIAVADLAGEAWSALARKASLSISGEKESSRSIGVELLTDIQDIFSIYAAPPCDRMTSADLIKHLCTDEEKPWATFNKGWPIKPRQVISRLKEFGIKSNTIRIGQATAKGFSIKQFDDAFARYLVDKSAV